MKSDFSNVEVRTVENNAEVVLFAVISRLITVKIINKTVMNIRNVACKLPVLFSDIVKC